MKIEKVKIGRKESSSFLPILGAAVIFPLTVIFWGFNYVFRVVTVDDEIEGNYAISVYNISLLFHRVAYVVCQFYRCHTSHFEVHFVPTRVT